MNLQHKILESAPRIVKGKSIKKLKQLAYAKYEEALENTQNHQKAIRAFKTAQKLIIQGLAINPVDSDALNLLSRISLELGDTPSAIQAIQAATEIDPDNSSNWYSAGHAWLSDKNFIQAKSAFQKAVNISPGETRAEISLAYTYTQLQEPIKAFELYREIVKTQPDDIQTQSQLLNSANTLTADYYDQQLEHDLITYLNWQNVNLSQLANLSCSLLEHKFHLNAEGSAAQFDEMANSELLQLALNKTLIKSHLLEKLIMALRYELLTHATQSGHLNHLYIPLSNAIGLYGLNSEFILPVTDAEKNMVDALKRLINQSLEKVGCMPTDVSGALLLLGMYEPWTGLQNYSKLTQYSIDNWPEIALDLKMENEKLFTLDQTTFEEITSMPSVADDNVKHQYENFPYPRWDKLDYKKPTNYGSALSYVYPALEIGKHLYTGPLDILIAGCGTGRHALNVAKYFNHVNVTAIDLSQKSLAFAKFKAEENALSNIDFKLADLTQLKALPVQYDIIECSGVLHHIPDYKRALSALLANLKPNGLIKISLYSEYARTSINQIRELFSRDINNIDNKKIKVIRQAILQGGIIDDAEGIIRSDDFYSMSGTIDLLFHQFERQFTPIDLETLCEEFNLEFLGFSSLKDQVKTDFIEFHGSDKADIKNLKQWDDFEKENPNTFSSMYQFYCQYHPKFTLKKSK